jgi:hypothetical protein
MKTNNIYEQQDNKNSLAQDAFPSFAYDMMCIQNLISVVE